MRWLGRSDIGASVTAKRWVEDGILVVCIRLIFFAHHRLFDVDYSNSIRRPLHPGLQFLLGTEPSVRMEMLHPDKAVLPSQRVDGMGAWYTVSFALRAAIRNGSVLPC